MFSTLVSALFSSKGSALKVSVTGSMKKANRKTEIKISDGILTKRAGISQFIFLNMEQDEMCESHSDIN